MARGKPRPGQLLSPVLVYALAANGSQTGEGFIQGAGNAYFAGMQWRGITLGHADAAALNQFDIDISKAQAPEARTWLLQNKAEFIALMLGIEIVKIG
ncbi:hypothetical protein PGO11_22785 [Klebsiella aerogenes]